MSSHVCHEQSLQTNNSWLLILHVRHANSFSRRTVVHINLCPPHSVPCATRHANLPASTKPPRHRGDCAKGARKVLSQAATGRHPSANETVTTMLSQVSRVCHLNQTFCMHMMFTSKHVHRQSLSFPCSPPRTKAATLCTATSKSTAIPSHPMQHKQSFKNVRRDCHHHSRFN